MPLVERNLCAGVANNVLSTRSALEASIACGLERFLLISTDKAVNPTNVMGATKRFAELICQDLDCMGIELDARANEAVARGAETVITTDRSRVKVFVIPTNEELEIARQTMGVVI